MGGNEDLVKTTPVDNTQPLNIIAHENVLNRLTTPVTSRVTPPPQVGLPTTTTSCRRRTSSSTAKPSMLYHAPNAHTDGDTIVFFRRSDVIAAATSSRPSAIPVIDLARGGHVQRRHRRV